MNWNEEEGELLGKLKGLYKHKGLCGVKIAKKQDVQG